MTAAIPKGSDSDFTNHAKPHPSALRTGSAISPRKLKPVIATPKHIVARIVARTTLICIEIFKRAPRACEDA